MNKLYLLEKIKDTVTEVGNEVIKIIDARSRTGAAILREIKQKFNT